MTTQEQLQAEIQQIRIASTEMYSQWSEGKAFDKIYGATLLSHIHVACDEISKLVEA